MDSKRILLYVGTYTDSSGSLGIYIYEMKRKGDIVEFIKLNATKVKNPSFQTITNNKKYLLAVTEVDDVCDSQVHSYKIEQDGSLTKIQSIHTEGTVACYIVTDSHDKFAYIANYVGGTGCSIALNPDGTMSKGAVAKYVGTTGIVPERQEGPHMHAVKLGVGEKFVYLTDLGNDRVVKLNFDPIVGFSESSSEYYDTQPGSGPRHLTFHPNGSYLYVANELSNTVDVFKINALDGSLKHLQTIGTLPNDFKEESFVAEILISSDAKFLYVSNRGHNSLAIFSVSTDGSSLKSIGYQSTKGECPRNFNIIDDILLVANQNSDNIVPFKIAADGSLIEIGQILMCPKPVCLKFLEL